LTTITRWANAGKRTSGPSHTTDDGRNGMANKIEIRPLDKKETTGDSGGNGGS
jgi:hypothetical protein